MNLTTGSIAQVIKMRKLRWFSVLAALAPGLTPEMAAAVSDDAGDSILTKERHGCLSLRRASEWQKRFDDGGAICSLGLILGNLNQETAGTYRRAEIEG